MAVGRFAKVVQDITSVKRFRKSIGLRIRKRYLTEVDDAYSSPSLVRAEAIRTFGQTIEESGYGYDEARNLAAKLLEIYDRKLAKMGSEGVMSLVDYLEFFKEHAQKSSYKLIDSQTIAIVVQDFLKQNISIENGDQPSIRTPTPSQHEAESDKQGLRGGEGASTSSLGDPELVDACLNIEPPFISKDAFICGPQEGTARTEQSTCQDSVDEATGENDTSSAIQLKKKVFGHSPLGILSKWLQIARRWLSQKIWGSY